MRRHHRRRRLSSGSVAFALASALAVNAADAAEPNESAEKPAERRLKQLYKAEDAIRAGRPEEALAAWREAWKLQPSYEIACNIGRISLRYGSAPEAAEFLTRCTRLMPEAVTPAEQKRNEGQRRALEEVRGKVTELRIVVSQPRAIVRVDEVFVGVAPLSEGIFVSAGDHRVEARLDGFDPTSETLHTAAGEIRFVTLQLSSGRAAPLSPPRAPLPTPTPRRALWPVISASAAAALGAGLGTGFTIAASSEQSTARSWIPEIRSTMIEDCTGGSAFSACAGYARAYDPGQTYRGIAAGSFITAGVSAAVALTYLIVTRSPRPTAVSNDGVTVDARMGSSMGSSSSGFAQNLGISQIAHRPTWHSAARREHPPVVARW